MKKLLVLLIPLVMLFGSCKKDTIDYSWDMDDIRFTNGKELPYSSTPYSRQSGSKGIIGTFDYVIDEPQYAYYSIKSWTFRDDSTFEYIFMCTDSYKNTKYKGTYSLWLDEDGYNKVKVERTTGGTDTYTWYINQDDELFLIHN